MLYQAENLSLKKPNVEVSCGPDGLRACTGLYDEPPHYTPSAPLVCYGSIMVGGQCIRPVVF
jgi:hypothetical protein